MDEQGRGAVGANRAKSSHRTALRLDDYLPYRLSVTTNAVSRLIGGAYQQQFGITVPQWRLMAVLAEYSPLTQQTLCVRTVMDKVTVMRAAHGLVKRRLVKRLPNHDDRRSHLLVLSPAGKAMYAKVAPLALQYEAMLLNHLNRQEVKKFGLWLRRLQEVATAAAAADLPARTSSLRDRLV